ncbi:NUDIX domain-containing protein [Patescibacteria group bacterium]|nr:NUDIX domain-containing protein [Patescibacteria group bacterium]
MKKNAHQLTDDVKLLQKVVLIHGDKLLILQREENSPSRPLAWDLPGGNAQYPETLEDKENTHQKDAVREVFEETGIELLEDQFLTENLADFRTYFEAQKQVFSVIVGWKINLEDDFDEKSILISREHINYRWISFEEINNYNFGDFKGEFIKTIIKKSLSK